MRKIELTIASDYVPSWTIVDAISMRIGLKVIGNIHDNPELMRS